MCIRDRYGPSSAQDTTNGDDWIAIEAGEGAYASVSERSDGYDAALVVAVDHDGQAALTRPLPQRELLRA